MRRITLLVPIVAFLTGCGTTTTAAQQPTPPATGEATSEAVASTSEPAAAPLKAEDLQLRVKTLSQQCFGSAGCNVAFTIRVSYSGTTPLDDTEHQITYKVIGGTEPLINTLTLAGTQITVDEREVISTRSAASKLRAQIVEIE